MHHRYLTHLQSFLHDTVGTVDTVGRYDLKINTIAPFLHPIRTDWVATEPLLSQPIRTLLKNGAHIFTTNHTSKALCHILSTARNEIYQFTLEAGPFNLLTTGQLMTCALAHLPTPLHRQSAPRTTHPRRRCNLSQQDHQWVHLAYHGKLLLEGIS